MVQKFPTTTAYTPSGPDRANLVSAQKNFEDLFVRTTTLETKVAALETKVAALESALAALAAQVSSSVKALGTAASVASGGSVYVAGSDADPFVAGPGIGNGKVLITEPDGTVREAVDGRDFYWNRDAQPIFFKDLEVVSVTRTGGNSEYYPDGDLPPNRAGYVSTNYSNGHSMLEPIPLEEWNPPLAAMNKLPKDEARAILNEYTTSRGIDFMTQGNYDQLGSYYSDDYRSFLESKGITG
jgi:hypothetical protein